MQNYAFILVFLFSIAILNGQKKERDTLFFKYDKKYLDIYMVTPEKLYLKDSSDDGNGTFFFEKLETLDNLNPQKILCLKKYVRSSEYYDRKKKKRKLDDDGLSGHFSNYVIFLVKEEKGGKEFIEVDSIIEIE